MPGTPVIRIGGNTRRGRKWPRRSVTADVMLSDSWPGAFRAPIRGRVHQSGVVTFGSTAIERHGVAGVTGRPAIIGDTAELLQTVDNRVEYPTRGICRNGGREHAERGAWRNIVESFRSYLLRRGVTTHG